MFLLMSRNKYVPGIIIVITVRFLHHGACAQPPIQPEKDHVHESIEHAFGRDKRDARSLGDDDRQLLSCCFQIVDLGLKTSKGERFFRLGWSRRATVRRWKGALCWWICLTTWT
jgi:hypothetical protein